METKENIPFLPEYGILMGEYIQLMQKTAMEQDILDGGTGKRVYTFTLFDAMDSLNRDESAPTDKNIRHLFNNKNG